MKKSVKEWRERKGTLAKELQLAAWQSLLGAGDQGFFGALVRPGAMSKLYSRSKAVLEHMKFGGRFAGKRKEVGRRQGNICEWTEQPTQDGSEGRWYSGVGSIVGS